MTTLREELAADMADAIEDYEQSFSWQGDTYACVRSDKPTAMALMTEGGFIDGQSYTLVVAKSLFTDGNYPQKGDLINENIGQIKLAEGEDDIAAVQLILTVGSPDE
jgi:hypothetical protein